MKDWTTPAEIRQRIQRLWDNGRILAAMAGAEAVFPLRLTLKGPEGQALGQDFARAQAWIADLQQFTQNHEIALEFKEIQHRQLGKNRLPVAVVFEHAEIALGLLNKRREGKRFAQLAQQIAQEFPTLQQWLQDRPLQVLEQAEHWPQIASVLRWLQQFPRPGVYLRQLDVPGVDTKFIEQRKGLLADLLDLVLPAEAVDRTATGAGAFERRYNFLSKPNQIRFRLLDKSQKLFGLDDLSVPIAQFAQLNLPVTRVFITENDINGLAFPHTEQALVIFGLGYDVQSLSTIPWLQHKQVLYWGDIDTHGFAILDRLRQHLPHAQSLLMDREVLLAHRSQWVNEDKPIRHDLPRLQAEEAALYDDLRMERLGKGVRLEQERIGYGFLLKVLMALWS